MALYPNAIQKPLGKSTYTMRSFDILCLHTMVGYLKSTDAYFRNVSVFSHFGIGGIWGSDATYNLDGVVYQWGDTKYRAAANLEGNDVVLSVETADNSPQYPSDIAAWTSKQQEAIVDLMVWAHKTHGIPLVLIPDTKPGRKGIAYHRQGCDPWRVDGGVLWSSSVGKVCPGDKRIAQIPGLIEKARAKVAGEVTEELELIMAFYDTKADYEAAQLSIARQAANEAAKQVGLRALLLAMSGNANSVYGDPAVFAGWNLKEQLAKQTAVLDAKIAALSVAIQALANAPANDLGLTAEKLQEMMDLAARKATESLDLDVVLVSPQPGA